MESFLKKSQAGTRLSVAIATTGLALCCYYFVNKLQTKKNSRSLECYDKIPVPKGAYYYLGHLPYMRNNQAGTSLTKWFKQYGPIIHVKLGVQDWVFIGDAYAAHEIFNTQGISTSGRPEYTYGTKIMGQNRSGITFNDYSAVYKKSRQAALHVLSPTAVSGFHDLLWQEAGRCVTQLIQETQTNGNVESPGLFVRLSAFNVMLVILYARPATESIHDPFFIRLIEIVDRTMEYLGPLDDLAMFLPILSTFDLVAGYERARKDFWNNVSLPTFKELTEQADKTDQDSLAKKLKAMRDEWELNDNDIWVMLSELLVAGSDPSSVAMMWTYIVLCHHPEVQEKIRDEVDAFTRTHGRPPTFDDRTELPYYSSFQKELLRYRPPNYFGIPHAASKDIVYKNYLIPKGTILSSNTHTTHFDKTKYDEPEKFKPERFMSQTKSVYATSRGPIQEREQFVFGWGRRLCPGITVAEQALFNNITQLLSQCTIEPALSPNGDKIYPDMDSIIDLGASIRPVPCKLRFVKREDTRIIL